MEGTLTPSIMARLLARMPSALHGRGQMSSPPMGNGLSFAGTIARMRRQDALHLAVPTWARTTRGGS